MSEQQISGVQIIKIQRRTGKQNSKIVINRSRNRVASEKNDHPYTKTQRSHLSRRRKLHHALLSQHKQTLEAPQRVIARQNTSLREHQHQLQ